MLVDEQVATELDGAQPIPRRAKTLYTLHGGLSKDPKGGVLEKTDGLEVWRVPNLAGFWLLTPSAEQSSI